MPIKQLQLEILIQVIIGTSSFPVRIQAMLKYKMADRKIEASHVVLSGFII